MDQLFIADCRKQKKLNANAVGVKDLEETNSDSQRYL